MAGCQLVDICAFKATAAVVEQDIRIGKQRFEGIEGEIYTLLLRRFHKAARRSRPFGHDNICPKARQDRCAQISQMVSQHDNAGICEQFQTSTPSLFNSAMASGSIPRRSTKTSRLCSPRHGDGPMFGGVVENV